MDTLEARNEKIDWCIVGEPSSTDEVGDIVKNGRRGSLTGDLIVKGIQGHVAYPHLAKNPVHSAMAALDELAKSHWDNGNDFFPPTSFQISNIHAGTGAGNVIPGEMHVCFNFRFSTEVTDQILIERVTAILEAHELEYEIKWTFNGQPFLTDTGALLEATQGAIAAVKGTPTVLSTAGGTSDGRFIAPTGAQVIELGPVNATIHKIDECVKMSELEQLGFGVVAFACTTCNGMSGALDPEIQKEVIERDLYSTAVLSGNRNFDGRIHPHADQAFLASPPLVVAYAIAGSIRFDIEKDPLGFDASGKPILLKDIWPSDEEIDAIRLFDPLTGAVESTVTRTTVFPKTHYVTPREKILAAIGDIKRFAHCSAQGNISL